VADGSSGVFYIPLFHLLGSTKLHLAGLSEKLTVRMKTNVTGLTILSGSHPTVTEVALELKGYNEPNAHREARKVSYNNRMPLKLPFYNWQANRESQTLATSMQYTVNLSGLRGPVMGLFFTLRSGPNTGSTQGTYQAISSYDVQLASGKSMTGHYVKLHEDSKIKNAELFDNLFAITRTGTLFPFLLTLPKIMVPALIRVTKYLRERRSWYSTQIQQSLRVHSKLMCTP
jgi:hypothetical protein